MYYVYYYVCIRYALTLTYLFISNVIIRNAMYVDVTS